MGWSAQTNYRVSSPPAERPLLVFDGDCGFCRAWISRWRHATRARVDYAPSQEVASRFPEIPAEAFDRSVILVLTDGTALEGAEAVFRALAQAGSGRLPLLIYRRVPGAARLAEAVYGFVAGRRPLFSSLTRALWGRRVERPTYARSRSLFLRLMGLVYLIAFGSLWLQIDGLAGERGILPAKAFLEAVRTERGAGAYWLVPTLAWLHPGDAALHALCAGGTALSVAMLLGLTPALCLGLLWAFYLSLTSVCGDFLGFQWDNLLLEAGFLAIFLAPLRLRCRLDCTDPAPRVAHWMLRWLLFRLMFSSGIVKLASGDPAWRSLSALDFHYETQPLPLWTSWYAHQLPHGFQAASTAVMFAIELGAPLLIFAPRRLRHAAFWLFVGLQLAIAATGNYAFFNLLSIALCGLLLDDDAWASGGSQVRRIIARFRGGRAIASPDSTVANSGLPAEVSAFGTPIRSGVDPVGEARDKPPGGEIPPDASPSGPVRESQEVVPHEAVSGRSAPQLASSRTGASGERSDPGNHGSNSSERPDAGAWSAGPALARRPRRAWPLWAASPVLAVVFLLSLVEMCGTFRWHVLWPKPIYALVEAAAPFRSVNGYGLFAVMTTERDEIVVEGSRDGATWLPYEFKWKPGELTRRPSLVAPHQPRLDWQMWFAALGDVRSNPWFVNFLVRLLQGTPQVLALLEHNPFPDAPPRYVRALLYQYHFTGFAERRATGAWWQREPKSMYCPPISFRARGEERPEEGAR